MKNIFRIFLAIALICSLASCTVQSNNAGHNAEPVPEYQTAPEEPLPAEPTLPSEPTLLSEPEPPALPPETLSSENWPAHFAALVEAMGADLDERDWGSIFVHINSFHLMDVTLDGTPKLLVEFGLPMAVGPNLLVLSWDSPFETIGAPIIPEISLSGLPLRFFRNDDTGQTIYSSLIFSYGRWSIIYRFSDDFTAFRIVRCEGANNHLLQKPCETYTWETIEEFIATPNLTDLVGCDCDIQYGRNATDPTIVHLVNMALEGFTEIPAPSIYTFGDLGRQVNGSTFFTPEDVEAIQAWIFKVAENWGV